MKESETQKLASEVLKEFRGLVVSLQQEQVNLKTKLRRLPRSNDTDEAGNNLRARVDELLAKTRAHSLASGCRDTIHQELQERAATSNTTTTTTTGTVSSPNSPFEENSHSSSAHHRHHLSSSSDTATALTATASPDPTTVNTVSSATSSNQTFTIGTESTQPPSYNAIVPQRPARTRRRTNSTQTTGLATSTTSTSTTMSSSNIARGAFIVFEGLDRVGKSTLAKKLVEHLERIKKPVSYVRFPDRTTSIGQLINDQLVNSSSKKIDNRAMHLLFSANRWELDHSIRHAINKGTTVIADRYSYTGIAYSSANSDINIKWCCQIENGLPKPDLVIYLELPKEAQYARPGFGDERYETKEYQESIRRKYEELIKLSQENWLRLDVENKSPDQLLGEIIIPVKRCLENCMDQRLGDLKF